MEEITIPDGYRISGIGYTCSKDKPPRTIIDLRCWGEEKRLRINIGPEALRTLVQDLLNNGTVRAQVTIR